MGGVAIMIALPMGSGSHLLQGYGDSIANERGGDHHAESSGFLDIVPPCEGSDDEPGMGAVLAPEPRYPKYRACYR